MNLNQGMLAELDQELAGARKVLERIPAEKFDYKPHPKSGSMIWTAFHIATMCDWGHTTLTTPELVMNEFTPPPMPKTSAELMTTFDEAAARFRSALEKATDQELMTNWKMVWQGKVMIDMPRIAVLRGMVLNHMIHHRGQLTVYLRLNDIPVPGLYGPSADEAQMGAGA